MTNQECCFNDVEKLLYKGDKNLRQLPPLNALRAFEAAGRHLNFRLAAEELSVTQGAVAQHVRALEALLGVKLFHRLARGLSLTDEGRRYLPPIRRAFDMMSEATDILTPGEAVATISATPTFATRWIVPRLGDFAEAHPDIRIRLDASNTLANFQNDGIDIAIRQGRAPFGPGLLADLLFSSELIVACHPDLASGKNAIRHPRDLHRHVLLEDTHGQWPLFLEETTGGRRQPSAKTMRFSLTSMAIDAAIAGQGVVLTNRIFIEDDLRANRLCQPFAQTLEDGTGFYIVAPRNPRHPRLVDQLRGWLIEQAQG